MRLGFGSEITLSYTEEDITAAGWRTAMISPLSPAEKDTLDRRATMKIPNAVKDGTYTFYCSLSRRR